MTKWDKIKMLAASTVLTVEMIDEETAKERLLICEACEEFDAFRRKCRKCKCYMDEKVKCRTNRNPHKKLRLEITHCPLGSWGDINTANTYRLLDGLQKLK